MRSSNTRKERRKCIAEFFFISLFGPEIFHHCVRHNVRFWSKTIRNFYSCRKVFKVIDQNRTWFSNHLNWELNTSHRCDRNEPDNIAGLRRLISSSEHWTSHFHWLHLELNWTDLVAFRVKCRASPSSIVNLITFFQWNHLNGFIITDSRKAQIIFCLLVFYEMSTLVGRILPQQKVNPSLFTQSHEVCIYLRKFFP